MDSKSSFVKSKGSKKLDDLEIGDIVRGTKTGELYEIKAIIEEEDNRYSKATYFYFGNFLAHYNSMKRLFKTVYTSDSSHKMFMIYGRDTK